MNETVTWLSENWDEVGEILAYTVGIASVVTALTPTPIDNRLLSLFRRLIGRLSILTYKDATGTISAPVVQSGDKSVTK